MTIEPAYVLASFALAAPTILVVQTRRKRIRVRCCSGAIDARCDLRMRGAFTIDAPVRVDGDPPG
jgi:hypothetical protein